jgi:hypothetical protein
LGVYSGTAGEEEREATQNDLIPTPPCLRAAARRVDFRCNRNSEGRRRR